jgi:hypothetical protein
MKKEKIPRALLILAVLLLAGCQAGVGAVEPGAGEASPVLSDGSLFLAGSETREPENADPEMYWDGNEWRTYWDGGEWAGQPVVSLEHGISLAAHTAVEACGSNDASIDSAIEYHLQRGSPEESKIIIRAMDASQETTTARSITVNSLAPGIFLIECSQEYP